MSEAAREEEFLVPTPEAQAIVPKPTLPAEVSSPMRLIELAVSQGADIEKLGRLMDLQERWEQNQARKAWVAAMAAFKADPPKILKDRHVEFGNTKYDHATLAQVCSSIVGALSEHGLSHRWETEQNEGRVAVTCVITHLDGHSERTTLAAPADTSGQKNAIQAIASAVTYLQRYTLLAATGLAAGGQDDDGAQAGPRLSEKPTPAAPRRKSEAKPAAVAAPDPAVVEPCFVINVAERTGKKKNGQEWKCWIIDTDKHESFLTFSKTQSGMARLAQEGDYPVLIASEPGEEGKLPRITTLVIPSTGETA